MDLKVRFKKLSPAAVIPKKAHESDAGFDLVATSVELDGYGNLVYGTALAVEIPRGYVGLIFPRSSVCKKELFLTNSVGCVDSGYRGEIMAKFKYTNGGISPEKGGVYGIGDRIAQLIIMPYPDVEFEEAEELSDSDRGEGGYGSTGQ